MGSDYASIHSEKENVYVTNTVCNGKDCWLGLTDAIKEGKWEWTDGSDMDYTNWDKNEPNGCCGTGDYGGIYNNDKWHDLDENWKNVYAVCKKCDDPTAAPTAAPTDDPTTTPSDSPTFAPTVPPTLAPTAAPTGILDGWVISNLNRCLEIIEEVDSFRDVDNREPRRRTDEELDDEHMAARITDQLEVCSRIVGIVYSFQKGHLTRRPTHDPTSYPTPHPSDAPSRDPTPDPTMSPTRHPTRDPTAKPTVRPTRDPTAKPTVRPTRDPTTKPTAATCSVKLCEHDHKAGKCCTKTQWGWYNIDTFRGSCPADNELSEITITGSCIIRLYQHADFQGDLSILQGPGKWNSRGFKNDAVSSFIFASKKITEDCSVELCEHDHTTGKCCTKKQWGWYDIGTFGGSCPADNTLSKITIKGSCMIRVYQHGGYRGVSSYFVGPGSWNSRDFQNDAVSSFKFGRFL